MLCFLTTSDNFNCYLKEDIVYSDMIGHAGTFANESGRHQQLTLLAACLQGQ